MKLRNKKTGEIKNFAVVVANGYAGNDTLAELNAEWEDYEEPEGWWFIGRSYEAHATNTTLRSLETDRQIGNYFETKEEAEKAVEKLKAWKRLKDNGLKITGYGPYAYDPKSTHHINIALDNATSDENREALDLLFGEEE